MRLSLIKPIILVVLLIITPSLLITVFQLNSISQQEKAFEEIYQRQLTSVVFSINMYADDVVNRWVADVAEEYKNRDGLDEASMKNFVEKQQLVKGLVFNQYSAGKLHQERLTYGKLKENLVNELVDSCTANINKIDRLFTYLGSDYQKILVFDAEEDVSTHMLAFVLINQRNEKVVCAMFVDTERFILDVLVPRIQAVAMKDVAIGLLHSQSRRLIYANQKEVEFGKNDIGQDFWQLPSYSICLKPLGNSIQAVLKERSRNNLLVLIVVDFILLLGGVLTYVNVKKQLQLAKIKSDFVSNVSHEIRTPLSLISMYAESLQLNRVKGQDKLQRSYTVIYREARRLTGIVNNILNFSKIESGKRKFEMKSFDINKNVNTVTERYEDSLKSDQINWVINTNDSIPYVLGDTEAIDEALANLIDNAIKYSGDNKKIEVSTGMVDDMVWVEVKDNGIGIPKKEQKLIFKQFHRVTEGNLAHKAKGSGLGLNIVKQIIDAHKGKILLDSEPGKGSSFRIYLPMDKSK